MATTVDFPVGRGVSSTGRHAVNEPQDVRAVQELLNQIPPGSGGPDPALDVTGTVDEPTFLAICKFQRRQFHWADGLVDPRDKTLLRLNELAGTPLEPLEISLQPVPRLVRQDGEYLCWAAALESWLEVSPPRDVFTQEELVDMFAAVEDPQTGGLTNAGWAAVSTRFHMEGTLFSIRGGFLNPNELTGEFVARRLNNNGYLLFIYNLVPNGPSHVNVVYGVFERRNQTFVKVMDPFTGPHGGMQTRPLSFYTKRSGIGIMWARQPGP